MKYIETFKKFTEIKEGSTMTRFDGSSIYDKKQKKEMTKDDLIDLEGIYIERDMEDGIKRISHRDIPSKIQSDLGN